MDVSEKKPRNKKGKKSTSIRMKCAIILSWIHQEMWFEPEEYYCQKWINDFASFQRTCATVVEWIRRGRAGR